MLTYSQWRPDGGYDYFETPQTAPLGNDLEVPTLRVVNGIGVPSVEAGRPLPRGAAHAGSGELPIGVVAPMQQSKVSGVSFLSDMPPWLAFASGAALIGIVWLWQERRKR